jgi:tetratricopeptide (TPR) repeat protein
MSPAHAPARAAAAFLAVAAILAPVPARAMTAADARHDSFKLQAEGLRLYREGKYPEAVEVLQKVVNIHLNSFMAWYYLGAALEAERRYSDAVDPLKTALDLQPDHLPAHLALGDCYLKLGDAGEARAAYLRALDQQANYAPAHDGLGRLAESIGKDDEAEDEYRKALEINPAFADAYTHLGELYLRRAKLQEATDLFLKAIAMKPDFSQAYVRLGVALSRQGRYDDAIAAARKSQVLAPRDPEPLLALARIDLEMQNLKRAHKNVDQAIAIDPEHVYAHIMEAELARADGSLQLAQMILEKRLERPIDEPRWKRDLQNRLKQTRADVKILEGLQATAAANPTDPMATVALARFWAVQRDHRRAAELFLAAAGQSEAQPQLQPQASPVDPSTASSAAPRSARSGRLALRGGARAPGGAPLRGSDRALRNAGADAAGQSGAQGRLVQPGRRPRRRRARRRRGRDLPRVPDDSAGRSGGAALPRQRAPAPGAAPRGAGRVCRLSAARRQCTRGRSGPQACRQSQRRGHASASGRSRDGRKIRRTREDSLRATR